MPKTFHVPLAVHVQVFVCGVGRLDLDIGCHAH